MTGLSRVLTTSRYVTDLPEFQTLEQLYESYNLGIGVNIAETYALSCLVKCCMVTTKEILITLFEFVKSDDNHSVYLKKLCKHSSSIIKNGYYNLFRSLINKINKNLDKEAILEIVKSAIAVLHTNHITFVLHEPETLKFLHALYKTSKIPGIKTILADKNDCLDYLKLVNIWSEIMIHRYNCVKMTITDDACEDLYITMKSLQRKNIYGYLKKCALMDTTNSDEYRDEIAIQFSLEAAHILYRVGDIKTLKTGQIKKLLAIMREYGIESKKLDDYLVKITSNTQNNKLVELRREYKYLTPDVLSDGTMLSWDKLKLAKLNYEIKNRQGGLR